MTSAGRFILHRFNGDEIYAIESAVISKQSTDVGSSIRFEITAAKPAVQTVEDTAGLERVPYAEIAVQIAEFDPDSLVGSRFLVPEGTDGSDFLALLYYSEHAPMYDSEVNVIAKDGNRFHVRWTGTATDVNFPDGSQPSTKVEIDCEFLWVDTSG